MEYAVELEGLTKRFVVRTLGENGARRKAVRRELLAVDHLDLRIRRGELFGLLGPNGAGKTTTIRMLCTLLAPTEGVARVWGYDVVGHPTQVRRHLGVLLTGERSVYWKLTGRENLEYFAALYRVRPHTARLRITELMERVGLAERADDLVERYSTGMRQRLALIKTMIHDPPILLLDEPTTGLDPQAARNMRDLIRHLHRVEGKTILLTTHHMEEADQLCEQVGIIDQGRIIALDSPQALKRTIGEGRLLRLELDRGDDTIALAMRRLPGVSQVTVRQPPRGGDWEIILQLADVREALPRAVDLVNRRGFQVRHLQLLEPTLEDVFIALTGRRLRD